jgi:uncharacterized membrane protein
MMPWSHYQIGIQLHLWSVIPGLVLAVTQFVPAVRQKYPRYHRIAGRVAIICAFVASISGLMVTDDAFGGHWTTVLGSAFLGPVFAYSNFKAWTSIKANRLDQHRVWMLRGWGYVGSIITMRVLLGIAMMATAALRKSRSPFVETYAKAAISCEQLLYMLQVGQGVGDPTIKPDFLTSFGAQCMGGQNISLASTLLASAPSVIVGNETIPTAVPQAVYDLLIPGTAVTIDADITGDITAKAAALNWSFGPAFLVAIFFHILLVELYLRRSSDEDMRLKKVSELRIKAKQAKEAIFNDVKKTA